MDIEKAIETLEQGEGTTLKCSSQEMVRSFQREGFWFVLITSEYEDGTLDKTELKMAQFRTLYVRQKFARAD